MKVYKTDIIVEQHLRESFHHKTPKREERLSENINSVCSFVYVRCDFEVSEDLPEAFANFPPIFNNIKVRRDDIRTFIEDYAEKREKRTIDSD